MPPLWAEGAGAGRGSGELVASPNSNNRDNLKHGLYTIVSCLVLYCQSSKLKGIIIIMEVFNVSVIQIYKENHCSLAYNQKFVAQRYSCCIVVLSKE